MSARCFRKKEKRKMAKRLETRASYDVIVVGAGPGGASAAGKCAENGLRVALLEKCQRPGMKVCAGGLDIRILREFDIDDSVIQCHTKKHILYAPSERRCMTEEIESAVVYRKDFDPYLVERAVDAGVTLLTSSCCLGVLKEGNQVTGVTAKTPGGPKKLLAKIVIAADGFHSITARSAGLQPHYRPSDIGLAIQCETYVKQESEVIADTKHFFYGSDVSPCGFGWIYPKKHGYNVGLGSLLSHVKEGRLKRNLQYLIYEHPIASGILSNITWKSDIQAACLPLRLSPKMCGDGILIVGDAAGQVGPLGGNGIYYAMQAGALAGKVSTEALAEGDVSAIRLREYEESFLRKFGNTLRAQRRMLDIVKRNYNLYIETRIFVDNHSMINRIYDAVRTLAGHLF
jgi:digeranylgeranylglycerophospholipid reductase